MCRYVYLKAYGLLFLLLICLGCESRVVRKACVIERDSHLTCQEAAPYRCATPSRFQDLADSVLDAKVPTPSHYVGLLNIGEDALLARIHLIRAARESIVMQTFIWKDDEVGRVVFMELLDAARRGVKVRLILDPIGTFVPTKVLAQMAAAHENMDIQLFKPLMGRGGKSEMRQVGTIFTDFQTLNKRMHNKVFVVDRRIGMVGGRNIGNAYYDYDNRICYKDMDLLVIGAVVQDMADAFDLYWDSNTTEAALELPDIAREAMILKPQEKGNLNDLDVSILDALRQKAALYSIVEGCPTLKIYPVSRIEYVADWPEKNKQPEKAQRWNSTQRLNEIIAQAQSEIAIQTPCLIQDKKGIESLKKLRKERPDLEILFSTNSLASTNMFFVHALYLKQKQLYLEMAGAKIYEFKPLPQDVLDIVPRYARLVSETQGIESDTEEDPPLSLSADRKGPNVAIHAKFMVVDEHIAFVGSHNFDPRAKNLNTESAVILWDEPLARAIKRIFDQDTSPQNSWVVARRQKVPLMGNASELIAAISSGLPFFDLWPFGYSSNYQLREGFVPVPSDHPDFYRNYRDVGVFPQMELSTKRLGASAVKSFGGLFRDIM